MNKKFWIMLLISMLVFFFGCNRPEAQRKIRLSDDQTVTRTEDQLTTTIHLAPAEQRSIAVMFFENLTGDQNLEWLQKGLTEMFIRALSQSQSISVVSMERLIEVVNRLEASGSGPLNMDMAAVMAREANVETVLTGNISKSGDSLQINVKVHEPERGMVLKEENVEGAGLESIFGMVDQLTHALKSDLQVAQESDGIRRGIADLSTNSLEAWRHYTRGVEQTAQYLFAGAAGSYEKAIELDSTFIDAYLGACHAYLSGGGNGFGKALKTLDGLKSVSTERQMRQIEFFEAVGSNDFHGIMGAIRKWLAYDPKDIGALKWAANLYYNMGRPRETIQYYKKVLELDPGDKDGYNMLGYSYAEIGDLEKAVKIFEKYQKIAPDEANPFDSMGEVYMIRGKFREAKRFFKKAYKVNPEFRTALVHLAMLYIDEGNHKAAIKVLKEAYENAANDNEKLLALLYTALAYWTGGDHDIAMEHLHEAIDLADAPVNLSRRIRDIHLDKNDSTAAQLALNESFDKLTKISQPSMRVMGAIAELALLNDRYLDKAIDYLLKHRDAADNSLARINMNFFLTILHQKTGKSYVPPPANREKMEGAGENFVDLFVLTMKETPLLNYSDQGRFFELIHNQAMSDLMSEIAEYKVLIDRLMEEDLIPPAMLFSGLLADLYYRNGDAEKAVKELEKTGIPDEKSWLFIGPFNYENGFMRRFPPEKRINLDAEYKGKKGPVKWESLEDGVQEGFLNLNARYHNPTWAVGYGLIEIYSQKSQKAQLRMGGDDNLCVWLNGEEVWRYHWRNKAKAVFDGFIIDVELKAGRNRVLVKVGNWYNAWGYYFRVTDKDGLGLTGIQFSTPTDKQS